MVICQICKKEFKRITRTHLKLHDMSTVDYVVQFPNAVLISQELRESYGKFFRDQNPMYLDENKKLLSKKMTGRKLTDETKAKISAARTGKKRGPHSEETKKKISVANKQAAQNKKINGVNRPPYIMSAEARKRASERMKGNTLGKLGNHNKGKPLSLSSEQRANRSRKRVEFLKNNKNIKSRTTPELKFIEFLINQKLEFVHQYAIHTENGSWLYDFYIPSLSLFVEIDGEFWHSPRKIINRDKFKNNIIKKLGGTLARISTDDLNFSIIFNKHEKIWEINNAIINRREQQWTK